MLIQGNDNYSDLYAFNAKLEMKESVPIIYPTDNNKYKCDYRYLLLRSVKLYVYKTMNH